MSQSQCVKCEWADNKNKLCGNSKAVAWYASGPGLGGYCGPCPFRLVYTKGVKK